MVLLAKLYKFQPSEIDRLTIVDFVRWCEEAVSQVRREIKAAGG